MENECDKHPDNFMGMNAEESAWKFGNTSYFFQRNFFKNLGEKVYPAQAEGDRGRNRGKLAGGLELLSQGFRDYIMNPVNYVCGVCKPHMKKNYK